MECNIDILRSITETQRDRKVRREREREGERGREGETKEGRWRENDGTAGALATGRRPRGDGGLIAFLGRTALIILWKERAMRALGMTGRYLHVRL